MSKQELESEVGFLSELNLAPDDLACLLRQGFVSSEFRSRRGKTFGPYYKLRWRSEGRQRVKYLGRDFEKAAKVSSLLQRRRSLRRGQTKLGKNLHAALQALRDARNQLEIALAARGIRLHGYTPRRRAVTTSAATQPTPPKTDP